MTSAQIVETSVKVTSNSPSHDYSYPKDHNLRTYEKDSTPALTFLCGGERCCVTLPADSRNFRLVQRVHIFIAVFSFPDSNHSSFQLSFPKKEVSDYVRFDLLSCAPPLTAFTVCLWIKTGDQSSSGAMFSYSLPKYYNEILVVNYSDLKILIHDETR